jgi:hypothetical protein
MQFNAIAAVASIIVIAAAVQIVRTGRATSSRRSVMAELHGHLTARIYQLC